MNDPPVPDYKNQVYRTIYGYGYTENTLNMLVTSLMYRLKCFINLY